MQEQDDSQHSAQKKPPRFPKASPHVSRLSLYSNLDQDMSSQRATDEIHSPRSASAVRPQCRNVTGQNFDHQRRSSSPITIKLGGTPPSVRSHGASTDGSCDGSPLAQANTVKSIMTVGQNSTSKISVFTIPGNSVREDGSVAKDQPIPANKKRFWGEEKNADSIYSIYLKKINYTFNQSTPTSTVQSIAQDETLRSAKPPHQSRVRKNFFGYKYKARSSSFDKNSFSPSAVETRTHKGRDLSIGHLKTPPISLDHEENVHIKAASFNRDEDTYSGGRSPAQFLQWETRQIRVLQAATLDHVVKYILLINLPHSQHTSGVRAKLTSSALEDERNNVAHIIHVLFCTYRNYTTPLELLLKLLSHASDSCSEQFRFVMHYWMDNYPEDLEYRIENPDSDSTRHSYDRSSQTRNNERASSITKQLRQLSITTSDGTSLTSTSETSHRSNSGSLVIGSSSRSVNERTSGDPSTLSSETSSIAHLTGSNHHRLLIDEMLATCKDDTICRKAISIVDLRHETGFDRQEQLPNPTRSAPSTVSKNASVLDLDSRFVAQQLTAIDLEKFLSLRPYTLLEGAKSESVQLMIRNFNLLSRHVIVTILRSHSPHTVASHWIAIAMNLRRIKNFNSLKAIIAGLTNESIYRLKQTVWGRVSRSNMANFKMLSSIVDDVNNQTVLRQTQLIIEGTAKLSVEDDSFGTIPYLGTFLTDLNMIDARYQNFIDSPTEDVNGSKRLRLINFEKCSKQFEILTQVQLLQKNVIASLYALQRRHHFDRFVNLNNIKSELTRNQHMLLTKPAIPQVARLFRIWFQDTEVSSMTDKQCYEISLTLEQNVPTK
ncbi:Ral guanine nucleotide dissociation stimulator [Fragariocoptes setiger]|uniref:Ral guanine nucleotide dissociation stimulator n=1 Tax=Fragariocoptes setiger TaxID=1670756 RepID=A0ABQ7SAD9_9ACAR|nr:Ral guanine nucleotide dissociation stimulator [Fragariocoptes setiger]